MELTLIIDVDGVLSSGQFLYSVDGKSHKIFGAHDSDGLKLIRDHLPIHFISADERGFPITQQRVHDLGFEVTLVPEAQRFNYIRDTFGFDNVIYMGDGFHDASILKQSLFGIAPASARPEAKAAADYVTPSRAAEGAVLDGCLMIQRRILDQALLSHRIDATDRYSYHRLRQGPGLSLPSFIDSAELHTLYLHAGVATIEVRTDSHVIITQPLKAGEGWYATPGTVWRLIPGPGCDAVYVHSAVATDQPVMQITDDGERKVEQPLEAYGLITHPKKVTKPWGHELWIMWSRDYHVLKQISMTAGSQSSLQVHCQKLETNYLLNGQADVIDQLPIDTTQPEVAMSQALARINLAKYKERKVPGMHWTSSPGIVHRVIAVTDYIAYETSTPELDDVVRLQDDTKRASGRIAAEHRVHAL